MDALWLAFQAEWGIAPQFIPLFPLGAGLFPDGLLALRIFEVRYLDMVRRALKEKSGAIKRRQTRLTCERDCMTGRRSFVAIPKSITTIVVNTTTRTFPLALLQNRLLPWRSLVGMPQLSLGYTIEQGVRLIYLEAVGPHENFYRDIKR